MRHNISIGGHDVELYFQDMKDPHVASGLFSLLKDEWITVPTYDPPTIDENDVQRKAGSVKGHIDELETAARSINSPVELAELTDIAAALRSKVSSMRKDSLASSGEFGIGNLAFKELRNSGYMEKLIDVANLLYDNQYTD